MAAVLEIGKLVHPVAAAVVASFELAGALVAARTAVVLVAKVSHSDTPAFAMVGVVEAEQHSHRTVQPAGLD